MCGGGGGGRGRLTSQLLMLSPNLPQTQILYFQWGEEQANLPTFDAESKSAWNKIFIFPGELGVVGGHDSFIYPYQVTLNTAWTHLVDTSAIGDHKNCLNSKLYIQVDFAFRKGKQFTFQ